MVDTRSRSFRKKILVLCLLLCCLLPAIENPPILPQYESPSYHQSKNMLFFSYLASSSPEADDLSVLGFSQTFQQIMTFGSSGGLSTGGKVLYGIGKFSWQMLDEMVLEKITSEG